MSDLIPIPELESPDTAMRCGGRRPSFCSQLADYIESPPPYRVHKSRSLWLVLDAHGDSVVWTEQELAARAVCEALNAANADFRQPETKD